MRGCLGFSVVDFLAKRRRAYWIARGLISRRIELSNGTTMHCWVLRSKDGESSTSAEKPAVLLIHGFGADALTGWDSQIGVLGEHFDLYVPDLIFFGESTTRSSERSEIFQAECMKGMLDFMQVKNVTAVGHSYGGFVAFWMAHRYPDLVRRVVFVSSGILMTPTSNDSLLKEFGASDVKEVLLPTNVPDFKKTMKFVLYSAPWLPNFIYKDMMEISGKNREQRAEILDGLVIGSKNSQPLPSLEQDVLIVWGEEDRIFKLDQAHILQRHFGEKARLVVIKKCGHIPSMEKPAELKEALMEFLSDASLSVSHVD